MPDNTKAKGSKPSVLIPVLLVITGSACSVAGYAVWQTLSKPALSPATSVGQAAPAPIFFNLDTFTVNLVNSDTDPDRVLYVGLTLRLPDEKIRARLNAYLPEVRSRLLLLLSRQSATELSNEQGKQVLITQIKQVLAAPFVENQPPQKVSDVLFTAFILR